MKKKCKLCRKLCDPNSLDKKDICKDCLNKPKPKTYFTVKVECMLPATLIYHVYAEDAETASSMIKNIQPNSVKHRLNGRKEFKIIIYDYGCSIIKYVKNLLGS